MNILLQRLAVASVETAVATLIVLAISAFTLRRAPRLVALLWLAVLAKPLVTLAAGSFVHVSVPNPAPRMEARTNVTKVVTLRGPVVSEATIETTSDPRRRIVVVWLAGAALLLARAVYHRLRLRAIVAGTRPASARIEAICANIGGRFPRVRVSDVLDGPAIGGALRPVILIPKWMDERADDAQLEWSLRHELRHASARDTLAIVVRELALVAFWFHPLVWLAAAKWEGATELACDRDVVANDAEAVDYADALYRTLLNVRQQRRLQLAAGLFATRSKIGARIAALVERPLAPRVGRAGMIAAALFGVAVIAVGMDVVRQPHGHHRGNLEEVNDSRKLIVRYDAELTFDGDRIATLSEGSTVYFEEHEEQVPGTTRTLSLVGTSHGITRTFTLNGRAAPVDESFERTMTAHLREIINP